MTDSIENKLNEIFSAIKAVETRIQFLEDDLTEVKTGVELLDARLSDLANRESEQNNNSNKAERLKQFNDVTSRW